MTLQGDVRGVPGPGPGAAGTDRALKQTQDTLDHGAPGTRWRFAHQTLKPSGGKPGTWRSFWEHYYEGVPPQCALHVIVAIGSPAQTCWCTPASWRRTMGQALRLRTPWAMPCGRKVTRRRRQVPFSTTTKTTPWRRSAPSWGGPHHRLPHPEAGGSVSCDACGTGGAALLRESFGEDRGQKISALPLTRGVLG